MKRLFLLFLILPLLAACAGGDNDGAASELEIEGPALIMFYTDN